MRTLMVSKVARLPLHRQTGGTGPTTAMQESPEQFQSRLRKIHKRLFAQPASSKPRPPSFRQAVAKWWWAKSEAAFQAFKENRHAQGYELLRRLPGFSTQLFFYDNAAKHWPQLGCEAQALFSSQYKPTLIKLGLAKRIEVSPKGISFDCRLPARHLIEALKQELRSPTAYVTGTYGKSVRRKEVVVNEKPLTRYTKQIGKWQVVFKPEPYMIRLPLPNYPLSGDEIVSYFTTFVKDNAPRDFAAYRRQWRSRKPKKQSFRKPEKLTQNPRRQFFRNPEQLALALMAFDCAEVSELGHWLKRRPQMQLRLGIQGTMQRIIKQLHNSRRIIDRAAI
jgi:hypothetical protein